MTAHASAVADVLVIGGGPAGSTTAARLAERGHRVLLLESGTAGQPKACGELLTPRAVAAAAELGVSLDGFHRVDYVRLTEDDRSVSTRWPNHPDFGDHAVVAPRPQFDERLRRRAADAGATVLSRHAATAPIVERGFVRGAAVTGPAHEPLEMRAAYTVVADGANSRFGRELGTFRRRSWPYALAHRAVYRSALHGAPEAELVLDLHDRAGTRITGYGWMFPRGNGTVNVGALMMSTAPSFQVVKPAHVLERLIDDHGPRWQLEGEPAEPAAGGRIPLGHAVGPTAGPTWLVVGDAAAAANPMSGAGIEYAMETGMAAAEVIDEALTTGTAAALQRYPKLLDERCGAYFKVGRLANRLLGRPTMAKRLAWLSTAGGPFSAAFVRITANELRPGHLGAAELTYRIGRALSLVAPES